MIDMPDPQNDESKLIQIITWFLFVVAIFSVCARIGTKYVTARVLGRDDWLVVAAQAVLLAECISVSTAASHGLGKAWNTLTEDSINRALKAEYASTPLFILTLAMIRWSLSHVIQSLTPDHIHHRMDLALRVTVCIWAITSVVISLFQCKLPTPWQHLDRGRCIDRGGWWTYVAVLNIAIEVFTVILYAMIFHNMRTSRLRRAVVMTVFSTRLLVAAVIAVQLFFFRREYHQTPDGATGSSIPTVLNQAVLSLSVTTACVPYLRPFMESLEADVVRVENSPGPGDEGFHQDRSNSSQYCLTDINSSTANASSNSRGSQRNSSAALSSRPLQRTG